MLALCLAASGWAFFARDPGGPDGGPAALDLVAHLVIFATLTLVAIWCFGLRRYVMFALIAYAVATEVVQRLLDNGRSASGVDVLVDLAGIALAATLWKGDRKPSRSSLKGGC